MSADKSTNLEQLIKDNISILTEVKQILETNKKVGIEEIEAEAKDHIIKFMLEHMNIPFIDDEMEKMMYNTLLNLIFTVINKLI